MVLVWNGIALQLKDGVDICPSVLLRSGEIEEGPHLTLTDVVPRDRRPESIPLFRRNSPASLDCPRVSIFFCR